MTYRNDEEAQAYKRIADLEAENKRLRESASSYKPRREWKLPTVDFERLFAWTGWACVVVVAVLLANVFWHLATKTGEIEHCYIRSWTHVGGYVEYDLMGYRSWDENLEISSHDSVVNAYKAAELLKCPLLKR